MDYRTAYDKQMIEQFEERFVPLPFWGCMHDTDCIGSYCMKDPTKKPPYTCHGSPPSGKCGAVPFSCEEIQADIDKCNSACLTGAFSDGDSLSNCSGKVAKCITDYTGCYNSHYFTGIQPWLLPLEHVKTLQNLPVGDPITRCGAVGFPCKEIQADIDRCNNACLTGEYTNVESGLKCSKKVHDCIADDECYNSITNVNSTAKW